MYIVFVFTKVVMAITLRKMKSVIQSGYKTFHCFHLFMFCLFICHKQIDSNTPFKQMKETSVSVNILIFKSISIIFVFT